MNNKTNIFQRGKLQLANFYNIKLKRSSNFLSLFFGFVGSIIIIFPAGLLLQQMIVIYGYNPVILIVFLLLIWFCLLIFNGLSNYLIILIAKSLEKELADLQRIDEKPVFIAQAANLGFAIVSLVIIIVLAIQILGVL